MSTIREARREEIPELLPVLVLAEANESALRWSLENLSDTIYRMDDDDGALVGAATMRWDDDEPEIVELAIATPRQGKGFGKRFVAWLVDEARRRGKQALLVGTANASIENIAFYQKCGFRMHHVRPDYYWYHDEPEIEHGIVVRDMIVFRMALGHERPVSRQARRSRR
jgi:N-acetylglutamate synthase-like GNAT family acetyltransferase